jgi:hypothetical protein
MAKTEKEKKYGKTDRQTDRKRMKDQNWKSKIEFLSRSPHEEDDDSPVLVFVVFLSNFIFKYHLRQKNKTKPRHFFCFVFLWAKLTPDTTFFPEIDVSFLNKKQTITICAESSWPTRQTSTFKSSPQTSSIPFEDPSFKAPSFPAKVRCSTKCC